MESNIIRVFPRRTKYTPIDGYAFVGEPPMIRPEANEVHISVTFTWDLQTARRLCEAWRQYYPIVKQGGPAINDPGNGFSPGMYIKKGVTTTSRGCNHKCPWCLVWQREGNIRELQILPGNIVQDNNLLQCSKSHIDRVFDMLRGQRQIQFTGGLEARLITQSIADRIRGLRVKSVFLACDTDNSIKDLQKALRLLQLSQDKSRCYVLLKYDPSETILHALIRLLQVWEAGAKPFPQLYQPADRWIDYPHEWKKLARVWQRPAAASSYIKAILKGNV